MSGSAYSSATDSYSQTVSSDPVVTVLTDFTATTSHILVGLAPSDETFFSMEPGETSYSLYCQGPLTTSTSLTPTTLFHWSSEGADVVAPGPGECAWADRGPRGSEIKTGNTNSIWGFLNNVANLSKGKFAEIQVYRDPNEDGDMVVTKINGFVLPPF